MLQSKGCLREKNEESKTGFIPIMGINCISIVGSTPFFFLFAELDEKDHESKRRILKYFAKNELTVYCYESSKGYHFISPCFLTIEQWMQLKKPLKFMLKNYYEFINIRISEKPTDPKTELEFYRFNDKFKYSESSSLHKLIQNKFGYDDFKQFEAKYYVYGVTLKKSIINFVEYMELMLDGVF